MASQIKCPNCGIYNTNAEYCTNCGTLLSHIKRRELAYAEEEKNRKERERIRKEKSPSLYQKYKNHKFLIVRVFVKVMHSIWMAFMAIGMFIAWLVSSIVA
ncbi:zinc ribbon domain-containing protein [Bizionia argentinensis JUB59]|uniref:Zinc ribbon domain-containing protein n=1 Tax=Bizionia argentinensis JUB59 TaxID=1046627 RepID=G2ECZ7_9FLAO|nr:zinc ribbon domain-containing protein [Bizionia argentinensis]EGV43729.1 zinc ribbon domain-containing protein [Bizionia argentinensis JUB59]